MGNDQEENCPLCVCRGPSRGSIRVLLLDSCPMDCVTLRDLEGCMDSCRDSCGGEILFGFLPPGAFLLTLQRGNRCMPIQIRLPPGGNVVLRCSMEHGLCQWRRDSFRYFFNSI